MDEGIGFRKHTEDSRLMWQGGVISTVSTAGDVALLCLREGAVCKGVD